MIIPELVDNPRVILPQIVFDNQLDIHLGDVEVQLLHVGGHTTDQVVVYIPARRVLFGSDNIFHKRTPFIGHGDLVTWIDALERLSRLPIDIVVPGHGSIGGPELVTAQIDELKELLDRSLRGE
jgi:cyclase